ncbi:MAG: hypothetical protein ACFFAH_06535 [Promethearchaeota archaeon]
MVIIQQTLFRFLSIYIGFGILIAFFLILIFKILRYNRTRTILTFSGFYILVCIALILNFLYASIFDKEIVLILHYITIYFIFFSGIFIVNFCIILLKDVEKFTLKKQVIITIIYAIVLCITFLIPNGVIINDDWRPVWNLYYFLYLIILNFTTGFIPTIYYCIKIFKSLDDNFLRNKWIFFIIGIFCLYIGLYGTCIDNTLDNPSFRPIWSIFLTIFVIIGAYFMYYAVAIKFKPLK